MSKPPLSARSRQRMMSFNYQKDNKEDIDSWLSSAAYFFKVVLYEVDPSTTNEHLVEFFQERILSKENDTENKTAADPNFQETLELHSVQALVHLITCLGTFILKKVIFVIMYEFLVLR
jgi:hypothetical protein